MSYDFLMAGYRGECTRALNCDRTIGSAIGNVCGDFIRKGDSENALYVTLLVWAKRDPDFQLGARIPRKNSEDRRF